MYNRDREKVNCYNGYGDGMSEYEPPLDKGIAKYVEVLRADGIETYESCEGGKGHSYPEPAVRFHGGSGEIFRAFAIAKQHGFPVCCIRRIWTITDGEPTGPFGEIVFFVRTEVN